ncbi:MAG TPA: hypothetical protein VFW98_08060 [Gemmatimonadaceae bacterium]|nr:hypothetical protein [Gemmatimonadaceae bacterium]
MEVAAQLAPKLLDHLRFVLADSKYILHAANDWVGLEAEIRSHPIDVAVVDPCRGGGIHLRTIKVLLSRFPSLPIVLYTTLTPETLRVTVELLKYGIPQVVLHGFDDEPARLRGLLERQPARVIEERLLGKMSARLIRLPPPLAQAIGEMFRAPHQFRSVEDLTAHAGITRRSVDRYLAEVGLASAHTLLTAARVVRVYHYSRDPGYLMDDVRKKVAYGSARLLVRQVRAATGLTPSALRRTVKPEQFITEMAAHLHRAARSRTHDNVSRRQRRPRPHRGR